MKGIIVVTGASSGIGLATALHFGRSGSQVYAGVRSPETAVDLAKIIRDEKLPVEVVRLDVTDVASVSAAVAMVISGSGGVDVLINNAGIGGGGPIERTPLEDAQAIFDTNYFGTIRMIQAVVPHMRARRRGTIVNVSSLVGRIAVAGHGHYSASKWAVEGVSEVLGQELRPFGIRMIIIEPGVVFTPIFSKGERDLDPTSPYYDAVRRLLLFFQKRLNNPAMPETVATAIEEAIDDPERRLRYLVGADAKSFMAGRQAISDEQWIDDGRTMSDAEWVELMRRRYAIDLS